MNQILRYFVILEFEDSSLKKIGEKFSKKTSLSTALRFSEDLHFTLLYLPNFDNDKEEIVTHFKNKYKSLRDIKIRVDSFRFWKDSLIMDVEKSDSLYSFHHSMVNDLPKNLRCENKNFNSWSPHFGVAKINPEKFSDETKKIIDSAVKEIRNEILSFKGFRITRLVGKDFETLFSSKLVS